MLAAIIFSFLSSSPFPLMPPTSFFNTYTLNPFTQFIITKPRSIRPTVVVFLFPDIRKTTGIPNQNHQAIFYPSYLANPMTLGKGREVFLNLCSFCATLPCFP